jgi:hypothetical protein
MNKVSLNQFRIDVSFLDAGFEERKVDGNQLVGHFAIQFLSFVKNKLKIS